MKVVFIDSVHPILFDRLEEMGFECDELSHLSHQEIIPLLPAYHGAVIRSKFLFTPEIIDKAENLKFIARSGAGMENIDVAYANQKGIACLNSPEGNRDAVAEHALGMLLMLKNNLFRSNIEVKSGKWRREENRGVEIMGKTIGIIGFGVMGKAFTQRLKGFDCKVIAYDRYHDFNSDEVEQVSLKQLQEEADIVSLHMNYLPENHHFFNKQLIEGFSKPFTLINTARGKSVNTEDVVEALQSGKITGACLDVLEYESHSFEEVSMQKNPTLEYLQKADNVILSPHVAGWTKESYVKLSSFLADKIAELRLL